MPQPNVIGRLNNLPNIFGQSHFGINATTDSIPASGGV
jgi:hypothetical protein